MRGRLIFMKMESLILKCRRCIDPQHPGFFPAGILPSVRNRAFKIETVARLEPEVLAAVQPDFKVPAKNMEKFLTFMRIRFAAAAAGFDAEKMRLHHGVAPGEQFHTDVASSLEDFPLSRANKPRMITGSFKKRKNIGAEETGDAAKRGDRRTHLTAFEGAEESDGNAGRLGDLRERKATPRAQPTKALSWEKYPLCG